MSINKLSTYLISIASLRCLRPVVVRSMHRIRKLAFDAVILTCRRCRKKFGRGADLGKISAVGSSSEAKRWTAASRILVDSGKVKAEQRWRTWAPWSEQSQWRKLRSQTKKTVLSRNYSETEKKMTVGKSLRVYVHAARENMVSV
jgi:hypothetical protein